MPAVSRTLADDLTACCSPVTSGDLDHDAAERLAHVFKALSDPTRRALWVAIGRVGLGLIIPGLNAGALRLLPYGTEAAGSASINFFRQLGGALGVTLLALFLEGRERQLDAVHGLQPMQEGFFLIAFVYCLALIPAWRMTGRPRQTLAL